MTYDLNGKTAIVTGGSRGIGAAIAKRFAKEGAHVVLSYNSSEGPAKEVVSAIEAAGGSAEAVKADASDPNSASAYINAAKARGGIDILVHNAGIVEMGPVGDMDLDAFRRVMGVNVDAVYAGTHAAAPHIVDGGSVIVISSVNAHSMPMAGGSLYGASKAAASALARYWARDLGPRGIRVNAIQPGPVDTDMNPADGPFGEALTRMTALGRYGRGEEIAALAAFLASSEASYITGAVIDIDGGMTV
ncbi:MAG: SDR family oxidoreductase [Pseudomonadota bacterium]